MKTGREFWTGVAAAVLVGGLGLVLALTFRGRERERAVAVTREATQREPELLAAVSELGYARVPAPPAAPSPSAVDALPAVTTARAFLARHYGARWTETEKAMEAAGAKLDVPYVFSEWSAVAFEFEQAMCLKPEEVSELARGKFAWPDELTEEWLRAQYKTGRPYQLRPDDLPQLEAAVSGVNDELRARASQWAEQVQFTVQDRWATGDVLRAPYTTLGLSHEAGFWSKSTGGHGWAVTLTLRRADYPALAALEDEIYALRRRRDEIVVRYLHGTIGR